LICIWIRYLYKNIIEIEIHWRYNNKVSVSIILSSLIVNMTLSQATGCVLLAAFHMSIFNFLPENLFLKFAYKCLMQNLCSTVGNRSWMAGTNPYAMIRLLIFTNSKQKFLPPDHPFLQPSPPHNHQPPFPQPHHEPAFHKPQPTLHKPHLHLELQLLQP